MSKDQNTVTIIGNLTRDPETKPAGGTTITKFSIANNDTKKVGEKYEDNASFFDISAWGKLGETCQNFLAKGKKVSVVGRLKQERWETENGEKRSKVTIDAKEVYFLTPRSDTQANTGAQQGQVDNSYQQQQGGFNGGGFGNNGTF